MANNLVDCTTFVVDSNIFINIGLDPDFLLNCVICISNNSQCIKMSVDFFKALNIVLNTINFSLPSHLLLKEFTLVTLEEINGDNILTIKCLKQDQNVKLNKENVSRIRQLSDVMDADIHMKNIYTRSAVLYQACKISMYLGREIPLPKDTKIKDVEDYLTGIHVQELKKRIPIFGTCFMADLKIKALKQLARGWLYISSETEPKVDRPRTRAFVARERANIIRRLSFR